VVNQFLMLFVFFYRDRRGGHSGGGDDVPSTSAGRGNGGFW